MGRGLLHEPRAVGDRPGPLSPGGSLVDPVHQKLLGGCRERRGPGRRYRGAGRLSIGRDAASGMHLPTSDAGLACREGRCTWKAGQLWRQDRMRHRHRVPMRAGYPRPCGENNGALHNESRGGPAPVVTVVKGVTLATGPVPQDSVVDQSSPTAHRKPAGLPPGGPGHGAVTANPRRG